MSQKWSYLQLQRGRGLGSVAVSTVTSLETLGAKVCRNRIMKQVLHGGRLKDSHLYSADEAEQ